MWKSSSCFVLSCFFFSWLVHWKAGSSDLQYFGIFRQITPHSIIPCMCQQYRQSIHDLERWLVWLLKLLISLSWNKIYISFLWRMCVSKICWSCDSYMMIYTCGSLVFFRFGNFTSIDAQLSEPLDRSLYSRHHNPNSCYHGKVFFFPVQFPTTIPIEKHNHTFHRGLTVRARPSCRDRIADFNCRCLRDSMKYEFNMI